MVALIIITIIITIFEVWRVILTEKWVNKIKEKAKKKYKPSGNWDHDQIGDNGFMPD